MRELLANFFDHIWNSFRATFEVRAVEWLATTMMLLWGAIVLAQPGQFAIRIAYQSFENIAPQYVWGVAALSLGVVRFIILVLNGLVTRSPHLRSLTAFLSCFIWAQIVVNMLAGDWFTGLAPYGIALVFDAYNVIRTIREAALVDRGKRDGNYT